MLTSVEQLEKEIEAFHQNVVASNELMSSMKSIANILSSIPNDIKSDYDDMLKQFANEVNKLKKEMEDSEANINIKYSDLLSHLETLKAELARSMKTITDAVSRVPDEIKSDYKDMVKGFASEVDKLHKGIEDTESIINKRYNDFLSRLETMNLEQVLKVCQEIKIKQDEIVKVNIANQESLFINIKEHINKKMMLLYSGVGVTIILLIVSLILK